MLAGDDLIGVLNLESLLLSAFSPEHVRILSYAANQAAIAWRLSQQIEKSQSLAALNERLFEVSVAIAQGEDSQKALNKLAALACQWLEASTCDICSYDPRLEHGGAAGYELKDGPFIPRQRGWTNYMRDLNKPVWISNIENVSQFAVVCWDRDLEAWRPLSLDSPLLTNPPQLNDRIFKLGAKAELGLPITLGKGRKCVGIAWLKYAAGTKIPPVGRRMSMATGFAAQAGVILDLLQYRSRQQEDIREKRDIQDVYESITERGRISLPDADCYVLTEPFAPSSGGDFVSTVKINEKTAGFLIADAKGHGYKAAVFMLPLLATFKLHHKESTSTKYILERLNKAAHQLQVTGTAIYFILSTIEKDRYLFASSASHEPLIIWRDLSTSRLFQHKTARRRENRSVSKANLRWARIIAS